MAARHLIDEQLSTDPVAVSVARTMRRVVENREGIIADMERNGANVPVPGEDDMDREGALRLRAVQIDEDGRIGALFTRPSRFEDHEDKVMAFGRMVDGVAAFDGFKQTRVVSVGRTPRMQHGFEAAEFLESLPPARSSHGLEPIGSEFVTSGHSESAIPSLSSIDPAASRDTASFLAATYAAKLQGDQEPSLRAPRAFGVAPVSVASLDLDDIVSSREPRRTSVRLSPTPRPFGVAPVSVVSLDLDDIVSPMPGRSRAGAMQEGRFSEAFEPLGRVMRSDGMKFEGGRAMPSMSLEQIAIQQTLSREMVAFRTESKQGLGMFQSRSLDDGEMKKLPSGLTKGPKVADVAQAAWSRMKGALGIGG